MPTDPSGHVAASRPVTIGGQTYLLSPLRIREFRELESYLRTIPVQQVKPQLAGLPAEDRQFLLARAYDEGGAIRIGTTAFDAAAQSFAGMTYMFYLSARIRHPDLTPERATELMETADFNELADSVNSMAGFNADPPKPGPATATTPAATTTTTTNPST